MPDGSRRHFHANKLRPYVTRVSNVGVINHSDFEFGDVSTSPHAADTLSDHAKPREKLPPEKIAHLAPDQRHVRQRLGNLGIIRNIIAKITK